MSTGLYEHHSDLANQESDLVEAFGVYREFIHNETGETKQVPMDYAYLPWTFGVGLLYHPGNRTGIGLKYHYLGVTQRSEFPAEFNSFESTEPFIQQHYAGPYAEYYLIKRYGFGISIVAHGYLSRGLTTRVPVLKHDYTESDEIGLIVNMLNEEIELKGWGYNLGSKFILFNNDRINSFFKVDYSFSKSELIDDPFPGYIRNTVSKETGFSLGFSIIIG